MAPRFSMIAASALLHGGLLVAFGGHASAGANAQTTVLAVETEVETVEAPVVEPVVEPEVKPEPAPAAQAAAPPSHTHSYPVPASHDAHDHDPSAVHVVGPSVPSEPASPAPAPELVAAEQAAPARFVMNLGSAAVATGGETGGHTHANPGEPSGGGPVLPEASVAIGAKLVRGVTPPYPPDARANEIEAEVPLEIVVDSSGAVTEARVAHHAGYGFDEAALKAIRSFRFSPAQRDGHPVRVRMAWSVVFRLK